jgi:alpha-ketoglutarate-dependent taurine dioxygenase
MLLLDQLSPFGVIANSPQTGGDLSAIDIGYLKELVEKNRVVALRGFSQLAGDDFPNFCRNFGAILEWEFGNVNNLRVDSNAQNYLYTNHEVPFHWDGAFVNHAPHYIFFHCDIAPAAGSGGETLFCDTTRVLSTASAAELERWKKMRITYTTEKVVHYGGTFTSPVICDHPNNDTNVLRYAEPVTDLNPVSLVIDGLSGMSPSEFIDDMHARINDASCCYEHRWLTGDVVIADNFTLLHARNAFKDGVVRHIRRVNVL